jgi:tight adherence protein B
MVEAQTLLSSVLVGACVGVGAFAGREYYFEGLAYVERDLADKLRALRAPTTNLRTYLILWTAGMAALFVGLGFVLDSFVFGILAAGLVACTPWYLIRRMAEVRRQKIENQLADAMVAFSSAVRAGLSLAQSLDILATQSPRPVCEEFRQIVGEYNMGKPLERTLTEAKERLRSENFSLFAAALLASRKSGGRLNETVDRISRSVLELQRLERKVQVETAQARKSALYMMLAPIIILVVYYFVDPVNTVNLFITFPGQLIVSSAVVLNVVAFVWARKILNPDI